MKVTRRSESPYYTKRTQSPPGSRSPKRSKKSYDPRDQPQESRVLGVFGLSRFTKEEQLRKAFGQHGKLEKVGLCKQQC